MMLDICSEEIFLEEIVANSLKSFKLVEEFKSKIWWTFCFSSESVEILEDIDSVLSLCLFASLVTLFQSNGNLLTAQIVGLRKL